MGTTQVSRSARRCFLALVRLQRPLVYDVLTYGYATRWFRTQFLAALLLTPALAIVAYRHPYTTRAPGRGPAPRLPDYLDYLDVQTSYFGHVAHVAI